MRIELVLSQYKSGYRIMSTADSFIPWPWTQGKRPMDDMLHTDWTKDLGAADEYSASRLAGDLVYIHAKGQVPNIQTKALFEQSPIRIFPAQYILWFISPAISSPAMTPFSVSKLITHPASSNTVTIHDRDGPHDVSIKNEGELDVLRSSTGLMGTSSLSLQEAFDDAVSQYQFKPDELVTFSITKHGKTQGGIAGLNFYFVEVEPTS